MVRRSLVGVAVTCALLVGASGSAASGSAASGPTTPVPVATDAVPGPASDPFADVPPPPPLNFQEHLPDPANAEATSITADTIGRLGQGRGLAGQVVDAYESSIRVWWVGAPPEAVRAYAASRPNGVEVTIDDDAAYTRAQMSQAARTLIESPAAGDLSIDAVGTRPDGVGIRVYTSGDRDAVLDRLDELTAISGVRIASVTHMEGYAALAASP